MWEFVYYRDEVASREEGEEGGKDEKRRKGIGMPFLSYEKLTK